MIYYIESLQLISIAIFILVLSKTKWNTSILLAMIAGGVVLGISSLYAMGFLGIIVVIIYYMICLFLKYREIGTSILLPIVSLLLLEIGHFIYHFISTKMFSITSEMTQNEAFYAYVGLIGSFVISFILCAIIRLFLYKIKSEQKMVKRYSILFITLCSATFLILYANSWIGAQQGYTDDNIRVNSVMFLFYFAMLVIVFIIIIRSVKRDMVMQNGQQQYERMMEYTVNLEQLYGDMQKFRQDYMDTLLTMSEYIQGKDIGRLQSYFEQKIIPISYDMQSNDFKLTALHNVKLQELKGILSSKLIKAQELKIDTVLEASEPIETVHMESVQLCRCLGILLDNAIEEAVLCEAPTLKVALIKYEHSELIIVANSCREGEVPLYKLFEKGFSTKGSNRGLGLSNLKEIISQFQGVTLDTQSNKGEFVQLLYLGK
ncbi:GHKL domain-containing protein [Paenibacillus sp. GSMTC-2017]|uniref:sensor histidine kinase n=1 Tax=Paenibacillus sp. GSMTC-2017 TaxID=2794350 RepID=UPI0018D92F9A|nr:GHKL domain-containing protein [Paenibacillus sp. GSMTC-2017]MBH5320093.1 GHKL domain-containing protein [Paenibacillus sp. GSMTC-2017]